ncbi:hypothetical protein GJ496_009373 [Pomphorhynchus laevis]|nr:hypothetical protein GJ496_009373 [Pomphorhynchus laevis]
MDHHDKSVSSQAADLNNSVYIINAGKNKIKSEIKTTPSRPKLDVNRLRDLNNGLPNLYDRMKRFKFVRSNSESMMISQFNELIKIYEHWASNLFGRLSFDTIIDKIQNLGDKKEVKSFMQSMRSSISRADDAQDDKHEVDNSECDGSDDVDSESQEDNNLSIIKKPLDSDVLIESLDSERMALPANDQYNAMSKIGASFENGLISESQPHASTYRENEMYHVNDHGNDVHMTIGTSFDESCLIEPQEQRRFGLSSSILVKKRRTDDIIETKADLMKNLFEDDVSSIDDEDYIM